MGAGNVTLYARWLKRYAVTFNSQGGSNITSTVVDSGTTFSAPSAVPTLEYCSFDAWYTERQCFNRWDFGMDRVVEDTTLYAGYTVSDRDGNVYKTVLIGGQPAAREGDTVTRGQTSDVIASGCTTVLIGE